MSETRKALSEWAQVLSLPVGLYCAYGVWVNLHPSTKSAVSVPQAGGLMSDPRVSPVVWWVAFGAFVALASLGGIATLMRYWPKTISPKEGETRSDRKSIDLLVTQNEESRREMEAAQETLTAALADAQNRVNHLAEALEARGAEFDERLQKAAADLYFTTLFLGLTIQRLKGRLDDDRGPLHHRSHRHSRDSV